jgi:hypothetical protein
MILSKSALKAAKNGIKSEYQYAKGKVKDLFKFSNNKTNAIKQIDALIDDATKLPRVNGAQQLSVNSKGTVDDIFDSLAKGSKRLGENQLRLADGRIVTRYTSSTTGISTLQINNAGKLIKLRIK